MRGLRRLDGGNLELVRWIAREFEVRQTDALVEHLVRADGRSSVETCDDIARAAIRCRGDVRLGMTKAEVKETAWCEPSRIVRTETAAGQREQWIYSKDRLAPGLDRPVGSLEFTGDRLTSIRRRSQ